jgi:ABC-type branched-subunit amino acid transport system permease subunit
VGLTYGILLLSLGLLVKDSGQVSLWRSTFAAIGAVALSQFVENNLPWLLCLSHSALVAVPIDAIVAIPAIRLSGCSSHWRPPGFAILVEQLLFGGN